MTSTEHPEYNNSINRIKADMKDAEDKSAKGDAAGAAAATGSLINDVFAAQYRFPSADYTKSLNQELVAQKLLPPGFELTGTTHTDKGNILKMKDKQSGNSFFVSANDIKILTPKN